MKNSIVIRQPGDGMAEHGKEYVTAMLNSTPFVRLVKNKDG